MLDGKTFLAIIPARGGSKGVLRKNIRTVAGKPLIAWTIEAAQKSLLLDRLILSSDDEEIISVASALGCDVPFVRPAELARDDTPGIDPVLHALAALPEKYDYVVLLQPTSPLRSSEDIDAGIRFCLKQSAKCCVSVVESAKHPYWMFTMDMNEHLLPVIPAEERPTRRQDLPQAYVLNGALYIAECQWLAEHKSFISTETIGCEMPTERSFDIDSELDLSIVDFLLAGR